MNSKRIHYHHIAISHEISNLNKYMSASGASHEIILTETLRG